MTIIDIDSLLTEVSADAPAGEDLEYDPVFTELERQTARKPEKAIEGPDSEPDSTDWKAIKRDCIELLSRTKDLRVAVLLTRALVNTDAFLGLADGLNLVHGILEKYWDSLHPQLDADDDNDPAMRINVLISLSDQEAMILPISKAPLVSVKGWGSYSLRDIHNTGTVSPEEDSDEDGGGGESIETIRAAFMECPIEDLKETASAMVAASSSLASIESLILEKVGSSNAPNLDGLAQNLSEVTNQVNSYLALRGEVTEGAVEDGESGNQVVQQISGEINSRESATRMMDKISEYFRKHEPSSPVPLLMQRAKRVSNMGFMEIVKDIAPGGLEQAQNIGGIDLDN